MDNRDIKNNISNHHLFEKLLSNKPRRLFAQIICSHDWIYGKIDGQIYKVCSKCNKKRRVNND